MYDVVSPHAVCNPPRTSFYLHYCTLAVGKIIIALPIGSFDSKIEIVGLCGFPLSQYIVASPFKRIQVATGLIQDELVFCSLIKMLLSAFLAHARLKTKAKATEKEKFMDA